MLKSTLLLILAVLLCTCSEHTREPNTPSTKIIGHRGSGANHSTDYQENTYRSVRNAFLKLDGAEIDIQCSSDGTIWLFHDADLPGNTLEALCVPATTDAELTAIADNDSLFTLTRLEEVFSMMAELDDTPYISLDVKGHFPNGCFENDNAPGHYFEMMQQSLSALLDSYGLAKHVMVETDYQYFLDLILIHEPEVETYLLGYSDFRSRVEVALSKGYHGVSFRYNDPELNGHDIAWAHSKGVKVQLWSLYKSDDFKMVLDWNPDFIQIGNLNLGLTVME